MTIKKNFTIAITAFVITVVLCTAGIAYLQASDMLRDKTHEHLRSIADLKKQHIESIIEENLRVFTAMASKFQLRRSLAADGNGEDRQEAAETIGKIIRAASKADPLIFAISVAGADGRIVASTREADFGRDMFSIATDERTRRRPFLEAVPSGADTGVELQVTGPLELDGKTIGYLLMKTSAEPIIRIVHDLFGLGKTGEVTIARQRPNGDAQFIFPLRFDEEAAFKRTTPASGRILPIHRAIERENSLLLDMFDYRGVEVLAVTEFVPAIGWGLVVKIDESEAFQSLSTLTRYFLYFIAATLVVAIICSYALSSTIATPLLRLSAVAARVVEGEECVLPGKDRTDGIGVLARSLEHLLKKLRDKNAELELANQELQAFSYSVSHDLRAPLRAMDGFSHALIEDHGDKLDDDARGYLERIRAAAQRMAQLIDDILVLSRISRREVALKAVGLSDMAENIGATLRDADPKRDVTLRVQSGLVARADEGLARVILENLLGNAWKFTNGKPRARIEFGVENANGAGTYFVRDNGVGFDMAYADKLFEPFQRLHSDSDYEGSGIGLATVALAIRRHGGRVWADSKIGEGTTLHFTFEEP